MNKLESIQNTASILMQDIVGDYEAPENVPEWEWVEANASYAHVKNGQDGVWEFFLNLSLTWDDIPEKLREVIEAAREQNCAYLIIHQGT